MALITRGCGSEQDAVVRKLVAEQVAELIAAESLAAAPLPVRPPELL